MAKKPFDTTYVEYPKMVWDPHNPGVYVVAKSAADVPAGWLHRHPHDPSIADELAAIDAGADGAAVASQAGTAADGPATDRAAVIAALRERGVTFNPRAATADLAALLT